MSWSVDSCNGCRCVIKETDDMLALKELVLKRSDTDLAIQVSLVGPTFWMEPSESNRRDGEYGWTGPSEIGVPTSSRPYFEDKFITVGIKFTYPTNKELSFDGFVATVNPSGYSLTQLGRQPQTKVESELYGVYKKEGFDEAYAALCKMKRNLTELDFASDDDCWDDDLVNKRPFTDDEGCLTTYTRSKYVPSGFDNVSVLILGFDIAQNMDFLTKFIEAI